MLFKYSRKMLSYTSLNLHIKKIVEEYTMVLIDRSNYGNGVFDHTFASLSEELH